MGDCDVLPRSGGSVRRPRTEPAGGRHRRRAGRRVTATEAERHRRRGLIPWWRTRTWGKDVETLARLHRCLLALEVEAEAEHPAPLPAPTLLAPPDGREAAAELAAPPPEETPEQDDGPELPRAADQTSDPAGAGRPEDRLDEVPVAGGPEPVAERVTRSEERRV